jgi:hypothetical protein
LGKVDRRDQVRRLARERWTPLTHRHPLMLKFDKASVDQRLDLIKQVMVRAAEEWLTGQPVAMVIPAGAVMAPEGKHLDALDLLESYVRPEEFLGVFSFRNRADLAAWLAKNRPFPLEILWAHDEDGRAFIEGTANSRGPVSVAIPLALSENLQPLVVPGMDEVEGLDQARLGTKQGPGAGWHFELAPMAWTPGMLVLAGLETLE